MPSYEPIAGYSGLVKQFRDANDSKHCTWNMAVTIWEVRGMQTYNGSGTNNLTLSVVHEGVSNSSRVFEESISNVIVNHVYKRTFHGQSGDFFKSSINIVATNHKLLGPKFIGQVKIGVLDVFLAKDHMLPMQWFSIVDPLSDLPVEPLGFVKMNVIITTLGERMAVQQLSPDAIADWELRTMPPAILQVPRLNLRVCSCHQYNIKFVMYQGFSLGAQRGMGTADPRVKVISCCGENQGDPAQNTVSPKWNALLQCPFYEPNYMDLITVEIHDAGGRGGISKMGAMTFSWKHIMCNQGFYKQPRWIDMFELPPGLGDMIPGPSILGPAGPIVGAVGDMLPIPKPPELVREVAESLPIMNEATTALGAPLSFPGFVERTLYAGRVLMAIEVEERRFTASERAREL